MFPKKFKKECVSCGKIGFFMNKEHLFPVWLIKKTKTYKTGIKWNNEKYIPALRCTVPLCKGCNEEFGRELEKPVSIIFKDIENGKGVSENEIDLLIRWLWKITGLHWSLNHPEDIYTKRYTIKERVLRPINNIRSDLVFAISLIKEIDPKYGDLPMGIDSTNQIDAIFASGVFSKIAIIVSLKCFEEFIPDNFSMFYLNDKPGPTANTKLFFPKVGFRNDAEAVGITKITSYYLSRKHDSLAIDLQSKKNRADRKKSV